VASTCLAQPLLAAANAPKPQAATRSITLRYDPATATVSNRDGYQVVDLTEATHELGLPGDPGLPSLRTRILVPHNATVVRVDHQAQEILLETNCFVRPVAMPVPTDVRPTPPVPNPTRYAADVMFPAEVMHWDSRTHRIRDEQAVTVDITPIRYRAARREVYIATEITITVVYTVPDAYTITASPPPGGHSTIFGAHLRNLVENPEDISLPATPDGASQLAGDDSCDYLVITSEELAPAFTALTQHRQSFNSYRCAIETTAGIAARYDGSRPDGRSDLQTQIRNCIRDYVNTRGITYVVLGGDDSIVPDRDCYVAAGSFIESEMPTDAYYAGLDGTWDDGDNDGIYGEHGVAGVNEYDLEADVFVGRIPVRTASDATAYIAKVVAYETDPPAAILRKLMMGGKQLWASYSGDRRPYDTIDDGHLGFRDDRHPHVSDVERLLRLSYRNNIQAYGWTASQVGYMFDTLTSWDGDGDAGAYAANADNMEARFSEGWNFLFHDTHGNTGLWNGEGSSLSVQNASALTGLTCFTYTIACDSGAFDRETSLGEAFLRNARGGALAYLGCSRYGWSGISPAFRDAFQTILFRDRTATIGPAFFAHKAAIEANYAYRRWVHFGLNLQGDPALRIQGLEPDVALTTQDAWASESGSDNASLTLTRTSSGGTLTVNLEYTGSATGTDYALSPAPGADGALTFSPGQTSMAVVIVPVNDSHAEPDETLAIRLLPSEDYAISGEDDASITIVDNDNTQPHTVSIAAPDATAAEHPAEPGTFLLSRSGGPLPTVEVGYTVTGSAGTADYAETLTGRVTLQQGVVSHAFNLTPIDDPHPEGHETVALTLFSSDHYVVGSAAATITITDDESPAVITLVASDPIAREGVADDNGAFTITRTGNSDLPMDITYALEIASSASEADFNSAQLRGHATLPAGTSSITLPVVPTDDEQLEATETVILRLTGSSGFCELGEPRVATVEILDDDNIPPSISVTTDCGNVAECGDTITITAHPEDPENAIVWVELLWDDVVIANFEYPPYTATVTAPQAGTYAVSARARDNGSAGAQAEPIALTVAPIPEGAGSGITHDWWTDVAGNDVTDLVAHGTYPDSPTGSDLLTTAFETPSNWQNNYGSRLSGYFIAPKDGTYRFTIAADDRGELRLGTSGSPASARRIAYVNNPTGSRAWDLYSTQTSTPITLARGQAYFIEALHKEGTGSDCLAVGVELPGGQLERPIPAHRLMPWRRGGSPITLSAPGDMAIAEAGHGNTYTVALSSEPTGPVTIALEATAEQVVLAPEVLQFSPQNWWIGQDVTVTAIDDTAIEADPHHVMVTHSVSGGGTAFDGATAELFVAIRDNDFELVKWPYKARFTFDAYAGDTVLTNIPVLINLSTNIPSFDYAQFSSHDGADLRFVTQDGTALSYEIETWNPDGESHVWVRLPELTPSGATIWAYWGNLATTNLPAAALDGSLWSSGYSAVWHLSNDDTRDATTHGNVLTFNGVRHGDNGIAGSAVGLDGQDAIRTAAPFTWDGGDFTASAWVRHQATSDDPQTLVAYGNPTVGERVLLGFASRETMTFGFPGRKQVTAPAPSDGAWHHWAGVYTRTNGNLSLFCDGTRLGSGSTTASNLPLAQATLRIGEDFGDARLAGVVDEVRFAAVARSEDWIQATYASIAGPDAFYRCSSVDIAYPVLDAASHVTGIGPESATIHGVLLSTGAAPASVSIFLSTNDAPLSASEWETEIDLGATEEGAISIALDNLVFGTMYQYRFYAENSVGGIWSDTVGSFTTPLDPPRCEMLPASGTGDTLSRLNGFVEYLGRGTDLPRVTVFWGKTDGGTNAAAWQASRDLGTMGISSFSTGITSLEPGTRYYSRARVISSSGESWASTTRELVTRTKIPTISDRGVVSANTASAVVAGMLDDAGGDTPSVTLFWGAVDGGRNTARWERSISLGTYAHGERLTGRMDGLAADTEYFYRWRAVNSGGASWSAAGSTVVTLFDPGRMDGVMHITFPGYTRSSTLTNFPVAITLSEAIPNFSYASFASSQGHDIRFTNADGTQALEYEIENWNTNGESIVWVRLPQLTSDTSLYVYWGDPQQMSQHCFTTNGAVWRAGYHGVWHFNAAPESRVQRDSSPNQRHAETPAPTSTDGQIALAEDFGVDPESAMYLDATPCNDLLPAANAPITAACWFRARSIANSLMGSMLIHLSAAEGWNPILLSLGSDDQLQFFHSGRNTGGDIGLLIANTSVTPDTWNHAAVVFDGSTFLLYLNGVEVARQAGTLDPGNATGAWIGSLGGSASAFDGTLDELRFSDTARSPDWIWAAARSQGADPEFTHCSPVQMSIPDSDGDGMLDDSDPDDDNDGMPDTWEAAYGLNSTIPADAVLDSDGDGMLNHHEYIAGTDPRRSDSVLKLSCIRRADGLELSFVSSTGRIYTIMVCDSLCGGSWTPIEGNIAGTGATKTILDTQQTGCRFYRIQVSLDP